MEIYLYIIKHTQNPKHMKNYITKLNDLINNISEYVYYKQLQGDMESVARWEAILERMLDKYADMKGIEW